MLLMSYTAPLLFITSGANFAINRSKHSYLFVMVFKNIMPVVAGNLHLFGLTKWLALKTGIINKNAKKIDTDKKSE